MHPRPTRVRTWLSLIPTRCWLTSPSAHYVTLCYAGLILLFNVLVLVAVVAVLRRTRQQQQQRARKDWMTVLGLTCLLGTTWGTAFCAFGVLLVPQLYLFTVLNSLQGQQPGGILGGGGFPHPPGTALRVPMALTVPPPQVCSSAFGTSARTAASAAPTAVPPDSGAAGLASVFSVN